MIIISYLREIVEKNFKVVNKKLNSLDQNVRTSLEEIAEIKVNLDDLQLSL